MDKIYEMLKSPDEDINTLGARLLVDLADNNIFKFVSFIDNYEVNIMLKFTEIIIIK